MVLHGSKGRAVGPQYFDSDFKCHDLASLYEQGATAERKASDFPLGLTDSFALTQFDWLESIREQRQPQTSGPEGLRDLACAFSILESDLAGQRVAVNDVLDGTISEYQKPLNAHFEISAP